jgi:DNA-binding transcriptional ArsR family regulator
MSTVHRTAAVFFALGDETRLAVLKQLSTGTELTATALAEGAPVTRQAIVKHLQVLAGAGLVSHHRRGREVLYALERRPLDEARYFLDAVSVGWDRALSRLRDLVEEPRYRTTLRSAGRKMK